MRSASVLLLACAAGCRSAEPASPQPLEPLLEPAEEPEPQWTPPEPTEGESDWVQLTSGEWLRGEVEMLRKDSFEFESDELDTLNLDWGDVAEFRTSRVMTVGLEDGRVVIGTVMVRGDEFAVRGEEVERFTRDQVLAMIPGEPSEKNWWSGDVSLGTTIRRGNTNQTDATADVRVRRRTPGSRITLGYNGVLTRVESTETSNAHRFDGRWDRFLSRRFYVSPLFFDAYNDRFQNIGWRVTPGTGAGYQLVDDGRTEWNVDAGIGYQYLRYDSVAPGDPESQESVSALLGTAFDTDLTEKVEFFFEYNVQAGLKSEVGTNQHARATLSVDLIGELDLDVTVIWDRVGKPVADEDGVVPKNDDYRMQVGFGWSF